MQEENKKDDLIDVGDADEKATEINLDEQQPKEEAAKEEEKVEVEQVEAKEEKPVEEKTEEKKDELKEYSDGVQKRIAKLSLFADSAKAIASSLCLSASLILRVNLAIRF